MRLGLMGGTFDPIHLGHLLAAEEALDRCQLDEVLFVPAGRPWMKEGVGVSPAHHRINMTTLAVAYNPRFSVSSMEMDREGPTYTVDTLEELFRENPSRELFLIVGADSVAQMGQWKGPERIQELCTVVAVPRPGYDPLAGGDGPGGCARVTYLNAPLTAISATEVRERVSKGLPVRGGVPDAVGEYIQQSGLYQTPSLAFNSNFPEESHGG